MFASRILIMLFCLELLTFQTGYAIAAHQNNPLRGAPLIRNYLPAEINGGPQIWHCLQDNRGMMYFSDMSGIIEFDGRDGKRIESSNRSIVRYMDIDSTGVIYAGASGDFGMVIPDAQGKMTFVSLAQPLVQKGIKFHDIWKVTATSHGVYFFSNKYLFRYHKKKISIIPVDFLVQDAYLLNNSVYLPTTRGLALLNDTALVPVTSKFITLLTPYRGDTLLGITAHSELCTYNLRTSEIKPFPTEASRILETNQIFDLMQLDENRYLVITENNEIIILGKNGKIIQFINRTSGLMKGKIYRITVDRDKNLWACMSNGVAKIDLNCPVMKFGEQQGIPGNVLTSCFFKGIRYIGTIKGIFYLPPFDATHPDESQKFIEIIPRGELQECWELKEIDGQLYAICSFGLWIINGHTARRLVEIKNPQKAHCIGTSQLFPRTVFIGMRGKLVAVRLNGSNNPGMISVAGTHQFPEIKEKIRSILGDAEGNLWLNTQYDGVYYIRFSGSDITRYQVTLLGENNGLTSLNGTKCFRIGEKNIISTENGLMEPVFPGTHNAPDSLIRFHLTSVLGDTILDSYAYICRSGRDQYLVAGNLLYMVTLKQGKAVFDTLGFKRLEGLLESMQCGSDSLVAICSPDGFITYDLRNRRDFRKGFGVKVRNVVLPGDSLLFDGCYYSIRDSVRIPSSVQNQELVHTLPHRYNSLTFYSSALFYEDPESTEFQHQLIGFDDNWSNWTNENKAVYTNLSAGKYTFRVRARNVYGAVSNIAEYRFNLSPPWYLSWWAILFYCLLSAGLIYLGMVLYSYRLKQYNAFLERTLEERAGQIIEQARELKTINGRLMEMDKFKQGIMHMIVHDLKNPINTIIHADQASSPGQINLVKQTGKQMLNMVMNILDVSKYEDSTIPLELSSLNLRAVSEKSLQQVSFLCQGKNIFISNLIQPGMFVRSDEEALERIFVNLLTNAIKFTPPNGTIILASDEVITGDAQGLPARVIRTEVRDNGAGIDPDKTGLIFEKFKQIESRNSGITRSTGLGLTYCKLAIEAQGGKIGVISQPGKGSTFWFTLSAAEEDLSGTPAQEKNETGIPTPEIPSWFREKYNEELKLLRTTEFYKISELISIIGRIDETSNPVTREWKESLLTAIDAGNETVFKKLLK